MTYDRKEGCVFCDIVAGDAPAKIIDQAGGYVIFEPLNPHAPGHVLVVPSEHVEDATTNEGVTGLTACVAARYMAQDSGQEYNLLTSAGEYATQTVMHLHWHIIPRDAGDGLHPDWPWCREGAS